MPKMPMIAQAMLTSSPSFSSRCSGGGGNSSAASFSDCAQALVWRSPMAIFFACLRMPLAMPMR